MGTSLSGMFSTIFSELSFPDDTVAEALSLIQTGSPSFP